MALSKKSGRPTETNISEALPVVDAGAVNVLYGKAAGLKSARNQLWHQDRPGIMDEVEANGRFGKKLAGSSSS